MLLLYVFEQVEKKKGILANPHIIYESIDQ